VDTPKGLYLAYHRRQRGAPARDVLAGVLAATLRELAFPRQMHWDAWLDDGRGELVFGRPIRWLLYLYGGAVVPFIIHRTPEAAAPEVQPVHAGSSTYGHRFFSKAGKPGRPIKVRTFAEYRTKLAEQFVILDRETRQRRIARKLDACATKVGGRVARTPTESTLLGEVPDLVEYPSVVIGGFPKEFLHLPAEVLTTTMIHHQHYFPVVDRKGKLKPNFLAVTNTPRDNVPAIAQNAERVLVARLRDARFFWEADRASTLESRLGRLDTVLVHKKMGSYRAKVERLAPLAGWIAAEALENPAMAEFARAAARLCKVDLTTDMVGEFAELQGLMGGIYAREEGQPEEIWKAIYHHYLPVGVEADAPPTRKDLGRAAVSWAAVSLADKLDTLVGLFRAGERPTGSRDPFGLRRQAHGVFRILVDLPELTGLSARPTMGELLTATEQQFGLEPGAEFVLSLGHFLKERLRYVMEQRGFDVRNVRAVAGVGPNVDPLRPVDVRRKLEILPEFTDTADFKQMATVFKRVKNIAKELPEDAFHFAEITSEPFQDLLEEPSEKALLDEFDRRKPVIEAAIVSGDGFRRAFAEASKFGPAVDRFFTEVFVMVEDARLRKARLRLMRRIEKLILGLADVSEMVPEAEAA
jgi:glycyl-tRNA synthetase beta chain